MAITEANLFRLTYIFGGPQVGWSETIVINSVSGSIDDAETVGYNIAKLRAPLLGKEYFVKGQRTALIRVAGVKQLNVSQRKRNGYPLKGSQLVSNSGDDDSLCVVTDWTSTDRRREKQSFLGGIPDAICVDAGTYDPSGAGGWGGRFDSWSGAVVQSNGGWITDTKIGEANIDAYTSSASGIVTLTLSNALLTPFATGSLIEVRVKKLNGGGPLNGLLLVRVLSTNSCETVKAIAVGPFRSIGILSAYSHPFAGVQLDGGITGRIVAGQIGEHKRGRPLLRSPARSKARILF